MIGAFSKDLLAAVNFSLHSCDDKFELNKSKLCNAIHSLCVHFLALSIPTST